MQRSDWDRLAAPFPTQAVSWRILEIAADERSARLRPYLRADAVVARLDEILGQGGWSFRYRSFGTAVGCEIESGGVIKSAIVAPLRETDGPQECGEFALAGAAEYLGMRPPLDISEAYWVDFDPEDGQALLPEFGAVAIPELPVPEATPERGAEKPESLKPAGQQAIDRLVERLKAEGSGLEAARLLVEYGGYGSNPEAARELYSRLRELLAQRAEAAT